MKFRTEYPPKKSSLKLDPEKPVVLLGSCFSQNMAMKMKESGWEAYLPGGTLYNPLSIILALDCLLDLSNDEKTFEKSLFYSDGIWHSHLFDSSFSSSERADCIAEHINRKESLVKAFDQGGCLIVTFGTAICYYLKTGDYPVGNCHKQPAEEYIRRRLEIEEIAESWRSLIEKLRSRWPALKIIFTVSPVRHLKDGFEGNAMSKAILHLAVEKICLTNQETEYFPAYEILNDDLRDYRFYANDLVHPSSEAVSYVWDIFKETYLDESGKKELKEREKIIKRENHRPLSGALGKPLQKKDGHP